jgi:hypothetical protein
MAKNHLVLDLGLSMAVAVVLKQNSDFAKEVEVVRKQNWDLAKQVQAARRAGYDIVEVEKLETSGAQYRASLESGRQKLDYRLAC